MEHHGQGWDKVPKHLLDLIFKKLKTTVDGLQFGVICESWNCIMKDNNVKLFQMQTVPMLLVPKKDDPKCIVYDIVNNKFLSSKLEIPFKKRFAGSSRGWLVAVNEDWTVTLYKPFSSVLVDSCIQLPILFPPDLTDVDSMTHGTDPWSFKEYHIRKVVITADPLENPKECIVFAIYGEFEAEELAFFRPGKDSAWTKIPTEGRGILAVRDIVQYRNQLCIASSGSEFYSLDFDTVFDDGNSNLKTAGPRDIITSASAKRYLVESCHGKLYQVKRYFKFVFGDEDRRFTTKFEVRALDSDRGEWIEVTSLKDEALFLGDNSSISINTSHFVGCEPNCIYFTHDLDNVAALETPIVCDVGLYHVQNKEFKMNFTIDPSTLNTTNNNPPIWIVPTSNV